MKTWLSWGDVIDFKDKFEYKGRLLVSRLFKMKEEKVKLYWNQTSLAQINWWSVPKVRERWNKLISGDARMEYPHYVISKYLSGRQNLVMVSPGCGTGSHERYFSECTSFERIVGFDISAESIALAKRNETDILRYEVEDFYNWLRETSKVDVILFHSSLHHLHNLERVIPALREKLNPGGFLIIHEYVGPSRMMWTKEQLDEVETQLRWMPVTLKTKFFGGKIKVRHYRPGLLRTLLSDPSESIESQQILPLLHQYFNVIEEKKLGGNILHLLLKDIAHHFVKPDQVAFEVLERLFDAEDRFILKRSSDFIFGIYTPKTV